MSLLKGCTAVFFIVLNTIVCCVPIYLLALPRALLPAGDLRAALGNAMTRVIDLWVVDNRVMLRSLRITRIDVDWHISEPVARDRWYLVLSNHQGWSDILVLQDLFLNRIPPLKFFVKRQLLWVPFIGFAMWLLDFPYVYRFNRAALAANPALRQKDAQSVAAACEQFQWRPTSVLNFVEGTRFTAEKHAGQQSRFKHLLTPKTGGVTAVVTSLGDRIDRVLDVTIAYPHGIPTFWKFLCGAVPAVNVHVTDREVPLAEEAAGAPSTRSWLDGVWQAKDERIGRLLSRP
jgi:1-acyl-sn-glycerol-3-phosphate acyltransferase